MNRFIFVLAKMYFHVGTFAIQLEYVKQKNNVTF